MHQKNTGTEISVAFPVPEFEIKVGKMITNGLSEHTGEMLALLL